MFGFKRKPKHVHTWSTMGHVRFCETFYGDRFTQFSTICEDCGHVGIYDVLGWIDSREHQKRIGNMAREKGWFK